MLAMTHESTKLGPMLVHVLDASCLCQWSVKITGPDRMGYKDGDGRITPLKTPKQWYRAAENILLASGRIVSRSEVNPFGVKLYHLKCKEHNA